MKRHTRSNPVLVLLAAISGCSSVKGSIESSVDLVDAILTSSGSDSSARIGVREEVYRDDVRLASRSFVEQGRSVNSFLREVGRIAERHGLTDWESNPATFSALGEGLAEADVSESDLETFLDDLGQDRPRARDLVEEGYRSARR